MFFPRNVREKRKNADQKLSLSVTNMLREFAQRSNQASLKMLHEIHNKQVNVDHRHLTITQNNRYLITHLKTKHELILSAGYATLERTTD